MERVMNMGLSPFAVTDIVKRQEIIGEHNPRLIERNNVFHVGMGIDARFARYAGVLMTSVAKTNPDLHVCYHILTDAINPEDEQRFRTFVSQSNSTVIIYYIDNSFLLKLGASAHYSTAAYYRLLIPILLSGTVERVLYLDADISCLNRIEHLAQIDLQAKVAAAVSDVSRVVEEKTRELALTEKRYFNSGVMLIDVARWIDEKITEKTLAKLSDNIGKFSLIDQDALNLVLNGKWVELDAIWNVIYDLGQMKHALPAEAIFLHYTGAVKPWKITGRHFLSHHYREFEASSLWAGSPLLDPVGYKEMEIYARLSLRDGDIRTGIKWYYKYLVEKIAKRNKTN